MAKIIIGIILLILGIFMAVWTKEMVRFNVWSNRVIAGAQLIPSQRTFKVIWIYGVILIIIGLILLIF